MNASEGLQGLDQWLVAGGRLRDAPAAFAGIADIIVDAAFVRAAHHKAEILRACCSSL